MPLTLVETNVLVAALGLKIPDDILKQKANAEEFKMRQEKIAAEAGNKPTDWRLRKDFDDLLQRALESSGTNQFDSAFKLLEEASQLLQQPDAPPPAAPQSAAPEVDSTDLAEATTAAPGHINDVNVMSIWREAKEAVDAKLSALRQKLLAHKDPAFARLADTGLFALGTGENVALMKALAEFRGAAAERNAVAAAALRYQELISKSPLVPVLDDNPFGVDVALRRTLGAALSQIVAATR